MTISAFRRRRLVEATSLALVVMGWAGGAPLAATASTSKPAPVVPLLCSGPLLGKTASQDGLALRWSPEGWRLVDAGAWNTESCVLKATTAGLNLLFEGNAQPVLLETAPQFTTTDRTLSVTVSEPVLCESYHAGTPASVLSLAITDPNGRQQVVPGFRSMGYRLPVSGDTSSGRFSPLSAEALHGPLAQCYGVSYASLRAGAADVPAAGVAMPEVLFAHGFEEASLPALTADLRIEILDGSGAWQVRNLQAILDTPFTYQVRVRNVGATRASGLRVKEFLADTAAPAPLLAPKVEAQGWTCTARGPGVAQTDPGTSCGTGTGVLADLAGFGLDAGASRTYTLTRRVPVTLNSQPNGSDGDRTVLAAALFYDPTDTVGAGDVARADNLASAVVSLTANPGPTISCAADPGNAAPYASGTLPATVAVNEDAAPLRFDCTVADPDGVASFTATSSNTTLVPQVGLLGTPAGGVWPLQLSFAPDQSGASTLTLLAEDSLGAQRSVEVAIQVAEVNDPPSFDIAGVDTVPGNGVIERRIARIVLRGSGQAPYLVDQDGQTIPYGSSGAVWPFSNIEVGTNCGETGSACSIRLRDFFLFVDAGSAPENAALQKVAPALAPNQTSCTPDVGFTFYQDPRSGQTPPSAWAQDAGMGQLPGLRAAGGHFDLVFTYNKSQLPAAGEQVITTCNFRFRDDGSPSATSVDTPSRAVIFSGFAGS